MQLTLHFGHFWAFLCPCSISLAQWRNSLSPFLYSLQLTPSCQGEWHLKHQTNWQDGHWICTNGKTHIYKLYTDPTGKRVLKMLLLSQRVTVQQWGSNIFCNVHFKNKFNKLCNTTLISFLKLFLKRKKYRIIKIQESLQTSKAHEYLVFQDNILEYLSKKIPSKMVAPNTLVTR